MKIEPSISDSAVVAEIGARIEAFRLEQNRTQKEVAAKAGVSLTSVRRLESGVTDIRLSTLVAVCRVLGLLERLDVIVPESGPQPMDLLRLRGSKRQRARQGKVKPRTTWQWGDHS